jgi:lipopolysaccharide export system protein LptA
MRPRPELVLGLVLVVAIDARAQSPDAKPAEPKAADAKGGTTAFFGLRGTRSKDPITITSDNLEYEYKNGVIVYRGDVLAVQGDVKIRSNELRITLAKSDEPAKGTSELGDPTTSKLQAVVASGSVRIDQGTRWAVGGKATFDQTNRTLVLTDNPVLHDGPNEVAGDRVVVYLDEDRSVVEGGRKRVKAVLFPGKEAGKDAGNGTTAKAAEPAQ